MYLQQHSSRSSQQRQYQHMQIYTANNNTNNNNNNNRSLGHTRCLNCQAHKFLSDIIGRRISHSSLDDSVFWFHFFGSILFCNMTVLCQTTAQSTRLASIFYISNKIIIIITIIIIIIQQFIRYNDMLSLYNGVMRQPLTVLRKKKTVIICQQSTFYDTCFTELMTLVRRIRTPRTHRL